MVCSYCDSQIEQIPDDGLCPSCGGSLEQSEDIYWNRPFEIKNLSKGYFAFDKCGIKFSIKLPKVPRKYIEIPYNEIYDVSFLPATKWLKGFLCVRDWKNRQKPLPKSHWDNLLRDSLIWFDLKDNEVFQQAYEFIKLCAAANKKNEAIK